MSALPITDLESGFTPLEPNHAPSVRRYPSAPAADLRILSYCKTCGREISADTAAENDGGCTAHPGQRRWRDTDDCHY